MIWAHSSVGPDEAKLVRMLIEASALEHLTPPIAIGTGGQKIEKILN